MHRGFGSAFLSVIFSMIIAIASVGMGSMHGAVQASDAQMEAFVAAGGSPADICGDAGHAPKTATMDCIFCLSAYGGVLPDVARSVQMLPHVVTASFTAAAENAAARMVRDSSRSPRGPPVTV